MAAQPTIFRPSELGCERTDNSEWVPLDGSSPLCDRFGDPFHWLPGWRWVREVELWSHRPKTGGPLGWFTDRFWEATETMLNILVSTAFWLSGVVWQVTLALMELALNPHDYADAFFRNLGESMAQQLSHAIGLGTNTQIALYMVVLIVGWIVAAFTLMRKGGAEALRRLMQTMIPLALLVVMYNAMDDNAVRESRHQSADAKRARHGDDYGVWDAPWTDLTDGQQSNRVDLYADLRAADPDSYPPLLAQRLVGTRWARINSEATRLSSRYFPEPDWRPLLEPAVMSPRWLFETSSDLSQMVSRPLWIAADQISSVRHEDAPVTNCGAYNRSLESIFLASYAQKAPGGVDNDTIRMRAMVPILVSRMWYQTYGQTYGAAQFGSYSGAVKAMCFNGESQANHVPGIEVLGVWDHTCRVERDVAGSGLAYCNPDRDYTVLDADLATGRFKPHRGDPTQVRSHMVASLACQYIDPENLMGRTPHEPTAPPSSLRSGGDVPWVHGDPISIAAGNVWVDRPWVTVGKAGEEEPPISVDTCVRWGGGTALSLPISQQQPVRSRPSRPIRHGDRGLTENSSPEYLCTENGRTRVCRREAAPEVPPSIPDAYREVSRPDGTIVSEPNFYERNPIYYWVQGQGGRAVNTKCGGIGCPSDDVLQRAEYQKLLADYADGNIISESTNVTLEDIGQWRQDIAALATALATSNPSADVREALPTSGMATETAATMRRMHGRDWAWRMFQGILALISAVAYFMSLVGLAIGLVLSQLILAGVFIVMPVLLLVMALPVRSADELPKKLLKLILGAMLAHAIFALVLSFVIVVGAVLGTAIGDVVPSMSGADQWARVILLAAVPLIALKLVGTATKQFGFNVGSFKGAIQATSGMALAQMGNDGGRSPGQYARQQMMRGRRMMYGANRWSRVADHFGGGATAGFAAGAGAGIAGARTTRNMPNMTSGPRPDGGGGPSAGMASGVTKTAKKAAATPGKMLSGVTKTAKKAAATPGKIAETARNVREAGSGPSPQGGGMPLGDASLPDFGPDRSPRAAVWGGLQRAGRGAAFVRRHKKKIIAGAAVAGALPLSLSAGAVIPALVGAKVASKVIARPMRAMGVMRSPVQQKAETIRARRRGVETAGRLFGMGPGADAMSASNRVTQNDVRRNEELISGQPGAGMSDEALSDIYENMERSLPSDATEGRRWAYIQAACQRHGINPREAWRRMFGADPPRAGTSRRIEADDAF